MYIWYHIKYISLQGECARDETRKQYLKQKMFLVGITYRCRKRFITHAMSKAVSLKSFSCYEKSVLIAQKEFPRGLKLHALLTAREFTKWSISQNV